MSVKYLDMVFDNCENIIIPIERVSHYSLGKLERLTDQVYPDDSYLTNSIEIKLRYFHEVELKYDSAEEEMLGAFIDNNNVEDRPHILGRILNWNDIVLVVETDENKNDLRHIYVPWGEDNWTNSCMSTVVDNETISIEIKNDTSY